MECGRASLLLLVLSMSCLCRAAFSAGEDVFGSAACSVRSGRDASSGLFPCKVINPVPKYDPDVVPEQWLWNDINGRNYLTKVRNQNLPTNCGSCWAFAATSSLSDRIKIARKAQWPDVYVSPQQIISCAVNAGRGCHGGDANLANLFMAENDISDETCSIYQARGYDNGLNCSKFEVCQNCLSGGNCFQPTFFYKYRVSEFCNDFDSKDAPANEKSMMAEIYHRGPITCSIAVVPALLNYTSGIFEDRSGPKNASHDVSVVGYGVDKATGLKYWLVRNSWGTFWGEKGFFRLIRGVNSLGIENGSCSWATPNDTWSKVDVARAKAHKAREEVQDVKRLQQEEYYAHLRAANDVTISGNLRDRLLRVLVDFVDEVGSEKGAEREEQEQEKEFEGCALEEKVFENGPLVLSPRPQDYLKDDEVPENWDWRNVNGTNYLSWTVNQHIPQYCGSCWAQGSSSALADRFIIADYDKYANLALSPQAVLNCQPGDGSCRGGYPGTVYELAKDYGIPDETCQPYQARLRDEIYSCNEPVTPNPGVCLECPWPPPEAGDRRPQANCRAKDPSEYKLYKVKEYGDVREDANSIKKEIYARGPIACYIFVNGRFMNYRGGIFSNNALDPPNHIVSLVGFGKDEHTGEEYWIGRNSWGTYWGEQGFFRIKMHGDNLGVTETCLWAAPDLE